MINILLTAFLIIALLLAGCMAETPFEKDNESSIDKKGSAKETINEKSNKVVFEGEKKPDLAIKSIGWSKSKIILGESATLEIETENKGDSSVRGFDYVYAIYDGPTLLKKEEKTYFGSLDGGDSIILEQINLEPKTAGTYSGQIELDKQKKIVESDEYNNFRSAQLIVKEEKQEDDNDEEGEEQEVPQEPTEEVPCIDSDGGKNYNISGACTDLSSFKGGISDFCSGDDTVNELYCSAGECTFEVHKCEHVCRNGICY
jgi:hypothetical protein